MTQQAIRARITFAYEVELFDGMRTRVLHGFVRAYSEAVAAENAEWLAASERGDIDNLNRYFCRRVERLNHAAA